MLPVAAPSSGPAPVGPPSVFAPVPVTLTGRVVRLEPLGPEHADGLLLAGHHEALWRVTVQPPLVSAEAVARSMRMQLVRIAAE